MILFDVEVIEELNSWRRFAGALRAKDNKLFCEMLKLCYEYFPAIQAKGSPYLSDALFMSLLLIQHKTIVWLAGEVEKTKAGRDASLITAAPNDGQARQKPDDPNADWSRGWDSDSRPLPYQGNALTS